MPRIRAMHPADVPFAVRLSAEEGWGIPTRDFQRILRLEPRGSFVATEDTRRVGIATTYRYGREIAWIGNVVVKKQFRGRRIGQRLVEQAIEYLHSAKVRHIALYSFHENLPFYRKLGFVQGERFLRLRRTRGRTTLPQVSPQTLPLTSVIKLDRKAFGADRKPLLEDLLGSGDAWLQSQTTRKSAAYMLVKRYEDMYELGPWVGFESDTAELKSLLQVALNKAKTKPVEVSCPHEHNRALDILRKLGFYRINEGRVMFYQRRAVLGEPRAVLAFGFLDKG